VVFILFTNVNWFRKFLYVIKVTRKSRGMMKCRNPRGPTVLVKWGISRIEAPVAVGRRRRDVGRGRSLCSSNMDSST
jgi:hypothetical protein